jgi:hypothetical protein
MMKRNTVPPRPSNKPMFVYFLVIFWSAVVFGLGLVSPFLPPSVMEAPVQGISPPKSIPNIIGYSYPDISFQTPTLDSSTTYYGNVTLCCLHTMPRTSDNLPYFTMPVLYIFSDSDYSIRSPSTADASINGETFNNYTLNGTNGTEILSIQFTPKGSGVYYFVVNPSNGECNGECNVHLYLSYYKTQTFENKLPFLLRVIPRVLSLFALVLGAYLTWRPTSPEQRTSQVKSGL